jgi:hypothetical protein
MNLLDMISAIDYSRESQGMDSLHSRTASRFTVPLLLVAAWFLGHETQSQAMLTMPSTPISYPKAPPVALTSSAPQTILSVKPWKPASTGPRTAQQRWVF